MTSQNTDTDSKCVGSVNSGDHKMDGSDDVVALHTAVAKNDQISIEHLLSQNPILAITPLPLENDVEDTKIYSTKNGWSFEVGLTPLHGASWEGSAVTVRRILDIDTVDVNVEDSSKEVPLHYAAFNNNSEAIKELLKEKNVVVNTGSTSPLHYASQANSVDALKELCKHPDIEVNAQSSDGFTPLHLAGMENSKEAAKELLKHPKININAHDNNGNTPLHAALEEDSKKTTKLLLNHADVEVNAVNKFNNTPLHYAALFNSKLSIKELLDHNKTNVNAEGRDQQTPLHFAASANSLEAAKELIQHENIEVNAVDMFGKTAHHYAAFHCEAKFIELLVKYGADLTVKDNAGDIAKIPTEVVEELLDDCILLEEKDLLTSYSNKGKLVKLLIHKYRFH